jgi:hypothetical protein
MTMKVDFRIKNHFAGFSAESATGGRLCSVIAIESLTCDHDWPSHLDNGSFLVVGATVEDDREDRPRLMRKSDRARDQWIKPWAK